MGPLRTPRSLRLRRDRAETAGCHAQTQSLQRYSVGCGGWGTDAVGRIRVWLCGQGWLRLGRCDVVCCEVGRASQPWPGKRDTGHAQASVTRHARVSVSRQAGRRRRNSTWVVRWLKMACVVRTARYVLNAMAARAMPCGFESCETHSAVVA